MLVIVENQLVVDFVSKKHETMAASEFSDGFKHAPGTDRARGIVRVDQHNTPCASCDLSLDVLQIWLPAVILIQIVRVQRDIELREHGGIKWIIGAWGQQIFAWVEQGRHA